GLDWIATHHDDYAIRVLNVSPSLSFPEIYATSPIAAAVEDLWNDGVAVVTSAGNLGVAPDAVWFAAGNDPRVITVRCLADSRTPGQLKHLVTATSRPSPGQADGAGALNITAALAASDHAPAASKQVPLAVGATAPSRDASTILWDGARWTSTYWDGARWTSA